MSMQICLQTQRSEYELYEMIEAIHLVRIDSKMPVPRGAVPVRLSGKSRSCRPRPCCVTLIGPGSSAT